MTYICQFFGILLTSSTNPQSEGHHHNYLQPLTLCSVFVTPTGKVKWFFLIPFSGGVWWTLLVSMTASWIWQTGLTFPTGKSNPACYKFLWDRLSRISVVTVAKSNEIYPIPGPASPRVGDAASRLGVAVNRWRQKCSDWHQPAGQVTFPHQHACPVFLRRRNGRNTCT